MVTDPTVFRDLAYVFVAAVLGGALARLAGQPRVLGYVRTLADQSLSEARIREWLGVTVVAVTRGGGAVV